MRTASPDCWTLPSSRLAAPSTSCRPRTSCALSRKANEDVRAMFFQILDLREHVERGFGEAVGEVIVGLVAAHVDERQQHGDRALRSIVLFASRRMTRRLAEKEPRQRQECRVRQRSSRHPPVASAPPVSTRRPPGVFSSTHASASGQEARARRAGSPRAASTPARRTPAGRLKPPGSRPMHDQQVGRGDPRHLALFELGEERHAHWRLGGRPRQHNTNALFALPEPARIRYLAPAA